MHLERVSTGFWTLDKADSKFGPESSDSDDLPACMLRGYRMQHAKSKELECQGIFWHKVVRLER